MNKLMTIARQFRDDESGAAMVEYSIMVGIIAVAAIATVVLIGGWVTEAFTDLCTALDTATNLCTS